MAPFCLNDDVTTQMRSTRFSPASTTG